MYERNQYGNPMYDQRYQGNNQYQGYNYQQNQPMSQIPPQQNQQVQSCPDWILVPTVADIDHVNVPANSKAWIMAQNEKVFAYKEANKLGLVSTDYYKFEKFTPNIQQSFLESPTNNQEYVTVQEYTTAQNELRKAQEELREAQDELREYLEKFQSVSLKAKSKKEANE